MFHWSSNNPSISISPHYGEYFTSKLCKQFLLFVTPPFEVDLLLLLFCKACFYDFFLFVLVVPSLPHTAADRQQETLHQSRGIRVRCSLSLRRHYPDLPLPAADYWRFDQISPQGRRRANKHPAAKPFHAFQTSACFHSESQHMYEVMVHFREQEGLNFRDCHSVGSSYAQRNALFFLKSVFVWICINNLLVVRQEYEYYSIGTCWHWKLQRLFILAGLQLIRSVTFFSPWTRTAPYKLLSTLYKSSNFQSDLPTSRLSLSYRLMYSRGGGIIQKAASFLNQVTGPGLLYPHRLLIIHINY